MLVKRLPRFKNLIVVGKSWVSLMQAKKEQMLFENLLFTSLMILKVCWGESQYYSRLFHFFSFFS